jgi:Fe-S-cluster containining protein
MRHNISKDDEIMTDAARNHANAPDGAPTMYKIIKLRKYDVAVPFICYRCGKCCRRFTPALSQDVISIIAEYLNKPQQEIKEGHEVAIRSRNNPSNNIKDCPFLNEDNECSIRPLRPECCRRYPLFTDLGAADVDCRGYKEFMEMADILLKTQIHTVPHYRRHYSRIRPVIDHDIPKILRQLMRVNSSADFAERFCEINKVKSGQSRR